MNFFQVKNDFATTENEHISFEIVSAFEWSFIIFRTMATDSIYKVRKPRMTKLGQGVRI